MTAELIQGATRALQNAITPLINERPHWTGTKALMSDSLYKRMIEALTAATSVSGASLQASKAPARIDVLTWKCDIDTTVARWQPEGIGTIAKLDLIASHAWAPDDLTKVKAMTSRCEHWCESAKELLHDNPPTVPIGKKCPNCEAFWKYNREGIRSHALMVSSLGAVCHACRTRWSTDQEIAVLIQMLA